MSHGGFLDQRPRSPSGLAIVIVAHVAAISALALSKMDVPTPEIIGPLKIRNIALPKDPPPLPPEPKVEPREIPQHKTVMTRPDPIVKTDAPPILDLPKQQAVDITWVNTKIGPIDVPRDPPPPKPLPDPVRMEARLDPRSELLPPYPDEEIRAEREGAVTIKVLIGTDGRVKRAEKVSAASDAFWRETYRHVLRNWRFKPATVDGRPVESSRTMTLRFVLDS